MAHHNTVFAQMLTLLPTCLSRQGYEFESLQTSIILVAGRAG